MKRKKEVMRRSNQDERTNKEDNPVNKPKEAPSTSTAGKRGKIR